MEELFIYLFKSSGLIAAFFLSYHFLLRKETFFTSNRWFLLTGLLTSVLLPLFFIKKVVLIAPKVCAITPSMNTAASCSTIGPVPPPIEATTNWIQLLAIGYGIVVFILVVKVVVNAISLFRLLRDKQIDKQEAFAIVDLEENISPFSFFHYIVFNSSLYTQSELESILLHEKVHSQQKHSFDVLIAKLFCVLFWFNPFIWMYKKALIQNLEYIADSKAVQLIEDKRVYQKALLKVVTHQHCLSITNQFYQSLIKKRIVMLNKNQSHKRNSWKYGVIIPALILFIVFFQVQIIAQEMERKVVATSTDSNDGVYVAINSKSTDADMKRITHLLKEQYSIKLKFSKVKRNANGEITGIKVEFNDKKGNSGVTQFNGQEPIKPIDFYKTNNKIGFGKTPSNTYSSGVNVKKVVIASPEALEAPEPPETPEAEEIIGDSDVLAALDELDEELAPLSGLRSNSRVYIQNEDEEPIVIINGEVIKNGKKLSKKAMKELKKSGKGTAYSYSFSNGALSAEEIIRIKTDALNDARVNIKKMNPEIRAQVKKGMELARIQMENARPAMQKAREEMERARPNMERAREEIERSRPELQQARSEMLKAREEMLQAKKEMEQAKVELEKAKSGSSDSEQAKQSKSKK